MKDYTAEVEELTEAYRANRVAKQTIRAEVKEKYREVLADEIRSRQMENDVKFARHLALVQERSGMPLNVIQDEVLRTRTWSRWLYWRDLAGIAPQRVSVALAREAQKPYRIEDGGVIVTRNADGPVEEFRIEEVVGDEKRGYAFWPYFDGEDYDRMMAAFPEGIAAVSPFLKEAFAKYGDDMRDLVAEREGD